MKGFPRVSLFLFSLSFIFFSLKMNKEQVQPFLTQHAPLQISNTQKLCYRHRPDLVKNRGPDEFNFQQLQHVTKVKKKTKLPSNVLKNPMDSK